MASSKMVGVNYDLDLLALSANSENLKGFPIVARRTQLRSQSHKVTLKKADYLCILGFWKVLIVKL